MAFPATADGLDIAAIDTLHRRICRVGDAEIQEPLYPMPPATRPSQAPADPLGRFGMSAEELGLRYADEIALSVRFNGDAAREIAEHEAERDDA